VNKRLPKAAQIFGAQTLRLLSAPAGCKFQRAGLRLRNRTLKE